MKNLFLFFFCAFISSSVLAQKPASPEMTTENDLMKIVYGAPSKKGRDIFGALVPYNAVWRTGANKATEVTFKKDVMVGGKSVKAGTYSLFTIPTEKEWTIILNSELGQWGAYGYDKVKDKNVAEVKVASMMADKPTELFTIQATASGIDIMWDKTKVSVPVKS
jgi:hypothetical protein